MANSVWEELLGSFARCVRGAVLISLDGQIQKSTLPEQDERVLNTHWIARKVVHRGQQLDLKTDTGWILAAPVNKRQILVVVLESGPYTCFKLDLVALFGEDSPSDKPLRLTDPVIMPQPPKRGGAHAVSEDNDLENYPLAF